MDLRTRSTEKVMEVCQWMEAQAGSRSNRALTAHSGRCFVLNLFAVQRGAVAIGVGARIRSSSYSAWWVCVSIIDVEV